MVPEYINVLANSFLTRFPEHTCASGIVKSELRAPTASKATKIGDIEENKYAVGIHSISSARLLGVAKLGIKLGFWAQNPMKLQSRRRYKNGYGGNAANEKQ